MFIVTTINSLPDFGEARLPDEAGVGDGASHFSLSSIISPNTSPSFLSMAEIC